MNAIIQIPELADIQRRLDEMSEKLDRLMPAQKKYLTVSEVAKQLQCNEDTVRRKAREGKLPVAKRIGTKMLFEADSI